MEGEMDRSFDDPNQVYQVGSTALYRDNRRNVLVEVGTIDIERSEEQSHYMTIHF